MLPLYFVNDNTGEGLMSCEWLYKMYGTTKPASGNLHEQLHLSAKVYVMIHC